MSRTPLMNYLLDLLALNDAVAVVTPVPWVLDGSSAPDSVVSVGCRL